MKLLVILILVLLLILFQGMFWNKFWARELTVDLHFADYGVTEGEDSSLIETITNRKCAADPGSPCEISDGPGTGIFQ